MASPSRVVSLAYRPLRPTEARPERLIGGMHPQEAFHRDRYTVRYRAALAGTGGGKTHAGAFEAISWALENPGSVGLLFEPDYPMVKRTMIPALEEHLGPLTSSPLFTFNRSDHRIEWANGSIQWLVGLQDGDKTEGINADYAWVDEARLVRKWAATWRSIKRRLRGSRAGMRTGAWITTHSPTKEQADEFEGPASARPEYAVYRWSTRDNPRLPAEYVSEIERSHSGAAYKLVVEGLHARPEGLVYSEFDPKRHLAPALAPREYHRFTYGLDWGWTMPAAIIAIGWRGEQAHIVDEYYRSHASDDDLIEAAKSMRARWRAGPIACGHERPAAIEAFKRAGLAAEATRERRVADGCTTINGMYRGGELRVDPGCVNVVREMDLYSYPPGSTKPEEPEKGNDHACIVSDSLVSTRYGAIRIGDVRPGAEVLTRSGYRRVLASGRTRVGARVLRVVLSTGRELIGTPEHPIWVNGRGWTRIDALEQGDELWSASHEAAQSATRSSTMGARTTATPTRASTPNAVTIEPTASKAPRESSIATSGRPSMAPSRKGIMFTTGTATHSTTTSRTWSWSRQKSTRSAMRDGPHPNTSGTTLNRFARSQSSGTSPKAAARGTETTLAKSPTHKSLAWRDANTAAPSMRARSPAGSARTTARAPPGALLAPTTSTRHAQNAADHSSRTSTVERSTAADRAPCVLRVEPAGSADVYNLLVDGAHEFFANGVLVHNCDSMRYGIMVGRVTRRKLLVG